MGGGKADGRAGRPRLRGRLATWRRLMIVAVGAFLPAACASQESRVQSTEQMLVAAGFLEKPAATPGRQGQLAALKPFTLQRQLVQVNGTDTFGYLYADPTYCHCVLTGDARAYQAYAQLAQQQKIAEEQLRAQQLAEENAFDWTMWGPYDRWGGAPVVVVHPHPHGHHHRG